MTTVASRLLGVKDWATRIVEDPKVQACLLADAQTGKLHPSVLTVLMTYAYGRPNLRDVPEPETPITIELNIPKPLILKVAPMPVTAEPPAAHPVVPFSWRVFIGSQNRERSRYLYIPDQITYPPFFGLVST